MTLEDIQNEVAEKHGYGSWDRIYLVAHTNALWPEVCKRYATECVKASLEKASENASVNSSYVAGQCMDSDDYTVDKTSITSEQNIILL